jgi:formylmethanofuran--tetrahydromethanopterin N-formyltransferase
MKIGKVEVEDTYAEAFPIKIARILITGREEWALFAAREATGFASSLILCPAEAGIEGPAEKEKTPDGRTGFHIMICHPSKKKLEEQVLARVSQCILTCATVSAWDGLPDSEEKIEIGKKLKFFGDGYESEGILGGRNVYRIPIMSGEFVVEDKFGVVDGVAGGNFFIFSSEEEAGLIASSKAVEAISSVPGVITPFPGGIVASGSKVGSSRYKFMKATTNERYCPTLREKVKSMVPENVKAVYEIIINGLSIDAVKSAMREGILSAIKVDGIVKISAGNYGGKLGKYMIELKEVLSK